MADRADNRQRSRRAGAAYTGGFEAVFAILIGVGIGYWVDGKLDSSPVGLLLGFAVGFGSFVLRLVRLGKRLQELADEEGPPAPAASELESNGSEDEDDEEPGPLGNFVDRD